MGDPKQFFSEKIAEKSNNLDEKFTNIAKNFFENLDILKEPARHDKKQEVKNIVFTEIKENKSDLREIKRKVQEFFHQSLSYPDEAYIEKKFLKYCSKLWLEIITEQITDKKYVDVLREVAYLDNIKSLSDIPSILRQSKYIELLLKYSDLFVKQEENVIIKQFRNICVNQFLLFGGSAKIEFEFMKNFEMFLSCSSDINIIIKGLDFTNFNNNKLSCDDFLTNVLVYCDNNQCNQSLKQTVKCLLLVEKSLVFKEKLKGIVADYLKPVEIKNLNIDNRQIIEVKSKNLIISEILPKLEAQLTKNGEIEEVYFVAANNVHIDANLIKKYWHGKNIVVLTKNVIIKDEVLWNVSGNDNTFAYTSDAGTADNGYGVQGLDGNAGESGGNILMIVENIENLNKLIITSNGGKGSKGQDGGKGRDGKNGEGITRADLDAKYPSVIKFACNRTDRREIVKKTIQNIKNCSQTIKKEWYQDSNNPTFDHLYIKALTSDGNKIVFSSCHGSLTCRYQAYFLYKGSPGQPGFHGGEYGLGGQGGFAGEIKVINSITLLDYKVTKNCTSGEDGENGKGGLYGKHGKQGWDMGWKDYQFWSDTVYYGRNRDSKINLVYYNGSTSDRIWSPYKANKGSQYVYAEMETFRIENKTETKYDERKTTRQNNDRKQNAQAVRKKTMSRESIMNRYSHIFTTTESTAVQNLRSEVQNHSISGLQAVIESQEKQQHQEITETKTKRYAPYFSNDLNNHKFRNNNKQIKTTDKVTSYLNFKPFEVFNNLFDLIEKTPSSQNWYKIKFMELNISQVQRLYVLFNTLILRENNDETELKNIENILIKKYRLAILQTIATLLLRTKVTEIGSKEEVNIEPKSKYLVRELVQGNSISNNILGTLNQYIFENAKSHREKISKYCKKELLKSKSDYLKFSMQVYVSEQGKSKDPPLCIKDYYDEHQSFLKKQDHSLNDFFVAFKGELFRPRHAKAFDTWIESLSNPVFNHDLEKIIQKDIFLNFLYKKFKDQLDIKFDWNKCCNDKNVYKHYDEYIRTTGPLSPCYRELLAFIFNVNIRIYIEDSYNNLILQDNHNTSSKQIIYLLLKNNTFMELDIDKQYLELDVLKKTKDKKYFNILRSMFSLNTKDEIDDYLEKKTFLFNIEDNESDKFYYNEYTLNEKEYIKKIVDYFNEGEKQDLKCRLEKISSQYIGQQGLIHNILEHLECEGRHLVFQELCYIINFAITSFNKSRKEQNTISWIIASSCQSNWIDELILLQLENYFRKNTDEKLIWRIHLAKIDSNIKLLFGLKLEELQTGDISVQCVSEVLYLLCNISNTTLHLYDLALSEWPYALKENYWTCRLEKIMIWQDSDLASASYYLLSVENIFGAVVTNELLEILEFKKKELSPQVLITILSNYHDERWNLGEEELRMLTIHDVDEWTLKMHEKFVADDIDRDITQIAELIKSNSNTSTTILNKLSNIVTEVQNVCNSFEIDKKHIRNFSEEDITTWVTKFKKNLLEQKYDKKVNDQLLAIIDRAIELKNKFQLRDTQRFTILALLTNNRSTLAQVSTGEGKSLVVVATAIIKALYGEKVDIVTSSSILAKRDAKYQKHIYDMFGIKVSHNCSEDIEKRKAAYSNSMVVYGDLSNFQRDYLLDRFYGKNILGDHTFTNIIVDEVDSMLLDKGNNMLYLSHDIAGLDKLESVYIYIWRWINRPVGNYDQIKHAFNVKAIKEGVLSNIYKLVKVEEIGTLDCSLNNQQKRDIWDRLIKAEILDVQGKLLKTEIFDDELKILSPEFDYLKQRLKYLLMESINQTNQIHVPNYLKSFIENHLDLWINSAITAFFMKAGHDYVVDVDRTGITSDRNANITILDRDTGTDQSNSQWDEALHQFLQLKHGCKISMQSLKAVFISNVTFFKLYRNLFGLTGTLGSQRERDLLKNVHKVDFITVPTAKTKCFHEYKPITCTKKDQWIDSIYESAIDFTDKKKQSVLIICQTVGDVETLHKYFEGKGRTHVHTYTRDYEDFNVIQGNKKLEAGQIIIATNLAGRGTDIKISDQLRQTGGLHVCLTYLPNNVRVEQQAFGRAARNGDKGSGQLIILNLKNERDSNVEIMLLKKERDKEELHRISHIKTYYELQIIEEENCFNLFKILYERINKRLQLEMVPEDVRLILLQSCLDKWAFWLDKNSKYIQSLKDGHIKNTFEESLNTFISQLTNLETGYIKKWYHISVSHNNECWFKWVEGNPIKTVQLGKYFLKIENYKDAQTLFNQVIQLEPDFSEAAHYFKAFTLTKISGFSPKSSNLKYKQNFKDVKKELHNAAKLFNKHSEMAMSNASIIDKIKTSSSKSIIDIDAYSEQQKVFSSIYYTFIQSIDDILGHSVTAEAFVDTEINNELAGSILQDLIQEDILIKPKVRKTLLDEDLEVLSRDYGVSFEILKSFISQFKGKTIDENMFIKALKTQVQLPSREAFWKILVCQKSLTNVVKYVIIDSKKLEEIDPSQLESIKEKIKKGELEIQKLQSKKGEIFLNVEKIEHQSSDTNFIFRKDDFKILFKSKYKKNKKEGIITFNQKGYLDCNKTEEFIFPCYDSIIADDFAKLNINSDDAEIIIKHLVKEGILKESEKKNNLIVYRLNIEYEEIPNIEIPLMPVYDHVVQRLLLACFCYRVAFQKIVKQLKEDTPPINLNLLSKPHLNLMFDIIDKKIIKPMSVNIKNKSDDIENKLKRLYRTTMTKDEFSRLFLKSEVCSENFAKKLIDHLIKKRWISKYSAINSVNDKGWNSLSFENIGNASLSMINDLYFINDSLKTRSPLDDPFNYIEKSIKKFLDNRLHIAKDESIKNIARTLEQLKSTVKSLDVPDNKLNPISHMIGFDKFSNVEEVYVMYLNGLDLVQQLSEMKWTRSMILNTLVVVVMGIAQIAIGAAILLYSAGLMTHVGNALINEGINDLFFAASALKSGYFSWNDYFKHKIQSVAISTISFGVGAYLSRGTKVSHFGQKLFGPSLEIGGKKAAEITGGQLIKIVGKQVVYRKVLQHIALKTVEGVVFGLANIGIDALVENCLKKLCEGISTQILTDIDREVDQHNLSNTMAEVYKILGYKKAKKFISGLIEKFMSKQSFAEQILPVIVNITSGVTRGIAEAVKKRSMTGNPLELPINTISNVVVWLGRIGHLTNLRQVIVTFIDNLDCDMKIKLDEIREKEKDILINENKEAEVDVQSFKKEMNDIIKSSLRQKAGQVIAQHVVSPILKEGANYLIRHFGNKIEKWYRARKEANYLASYENLKRECQEDIENAKTSGKSLDEISQIEKTIMKEYQQDLLDLMKKTKSPSLLAAIIKERVPMDLTCVNACAHVVKQILKDNGIIIDLTLAVEGECGVRQRFSTGSENSESLNIPLELIDNHFIVSGDTSNTDSSSELQNDCLYDAIVRVLPQLRDIITPEHFRNEISCCIEQNAVIRHQIMQGWHRAPLSIGLFGGARKESDIIHDEDSSSHTEERVIYEDYLYRQRKVSKHLVARFTRYFILGGVIQRGSELTDIPRDELVVGGPSEFQDQSSHRGREVQAAHVLRAQIGKQLKPSVTIYKELKNLLGHTQNVAMYANEFHSIGGDIDKLQSSESTLKKLSYIDYSKSITLEDVNIINSIKEDFIKKFDYRIQNQNLTADQRSELIQARNEIGKMNYTTIFQKGRDGYLGSKTQRYQNRNP